MKPTRLLTHKIAKLKSKYGYVSTSMLTDYELSDLKKGSNLGQKDSKKPVTNRK